MPASRTAAQAFWRRDRALKKLRPAGGSVRQFEVLLGALLVPWGQSLFEDLPDLALDGRRASVDDRDACAWRHAAEVQAYRAREPFNGCAPRRRPLERRRNARR